MSTARKLGKLFLIRRLCGFCQRISQPGAEHTFTEKNVCVPTAGCTGFYVPRPGGSTSGTVAAQDNPRLQLGDRSDWIPIASEPGTSRFDFAKGAVRGRS